MDYGNRNSVVALWVVCTILGSAIGLFLGSMAGEHIGFSIGDSIQAALQKNITSFPREYIPSMVAGFFYGAVAGFFPGLVQWLAVLRNLHKSSSLWVLLNTLGLAAALSLNSGVYAFLNLSLNSTFLVYILYMFLNGLITGFTMGILQWIYFIRKHPKAYWWLLLNVIGWGTLSVIHFIGFLLQDPFFLLVEFVFNIIHSIVFALFTGLALYLTFPQPVPEPAEIATI